MTRTASISVDAFDPEVQEAAREAARRAGVSVEEWVAKAMSGRQAPPRSRRAPASFDADRAPPRRTRRGTEAAAAEATGNAPLTVEAAPRPIQAAPRPVQAADPALDHLAQRLDEIDRRIADGRAAASQEASRSIEALETRMRAALETGGADVAAERLGTMLRDFEARIDALGDRISAPRALGRRGRPAETEVRDALAEIRQRQRELDGDTAPEHVDARHPSSPAITDLHAETTRLRDAIQGLASGRDLGTLETTVRTLAAEVQRAQAPTDLATIAGPIDLLRLQVERLAGGLAEDVHARVARDVERLSSRIDTLTEARNRPPADAVGLDALFRELDAVRGEIAALADPRRIVTLAQDVARLDDEIARLNGAAEAGGLAQIKPLLEEIRQEVHTPRIQPLVPALESRFDTIGAKLDALSSTALSSAGAGGVLARIDALAAKIDGLANGDWHDAGALEARLDRIDATLRAPSPALRELSVIHGALEGIAERLERLGEPSGLRTEALDGLERQVMALAARLDRQPGTETSGLEQSVRTLADEIVQLRAAMPDAAAIERATRRALGDAPRAPTSGHDGEVVGLRSGLADLRAHQSASETRIQGTLEGVHGVLERLVDRLAKVEGEAKVPAAASIPAARAKPALGAPVHRAPAGESELPLGGPSLDELLEPGARRPAVAAPEPTAHAADVKASFIAAARRAAQAAAAEASQAAPGARKNARAPSPMAEERPVARAKPAEAAAMGGLPARMRQLMRMRRSLVIGLAAAVLALGALKLGADFVGARAPEAPLPPRPATTSALPQSAPLASGGEKASLPAAAPSVAPPPAAIDPASAPRPESSLPKVPGMAAMEPDLSGMPSSLASLKDAALAGDAAAVFDLGARATDGRGMPRDPKLAARLFEKVASLGLAPAEYRLGNLNEKGVGVTKDLGLARQLYGRAADKGNVRAMHNLAVVLAENGDGGKPDYVAAVTWFRKAAEYGIRDSQYNLAVLAARGLGTPQDLAQAYLWFSAAAAQGDDDAGRKRDEVGAKLAAKDLEAAKAKVAAWRPKVPDGAANDAPQSAATRADAVASRPLGTSLVGAPPPGATGRRVEMPTSSGGKV